MKFFAFLGALLLIYAAPVIGQDTLLLHRHVDVPYFDHKVQLGDDLSLLAKKYMVPMMKLAEFNQISLQEGLRKGSYFKIPVMPNNYRKKETKKNNKPIIYIIQQGDNLKSVSRMFQVAQSNIQVWNNMADNSVSPGQQLLVGWVAYNSQVKAFVSATPPDDVTDSTPVKMQDMGNSLPKVAIDSIAQPVIDRALESTEFEQMFDRQTEGRSLTEASGAAVFYPLKMRVKKGIYYAFHNTAPKGTILKIHNPASGKTIYAKVLGAIPDLGEYQHAEVTISNNAIGELDATDRRMFCKLYYR